MAYARRTVVIGIVLIFAIQIVHPRHVHGISTDREKELSEEFMEMVLTYFDLVRDPLITDYVDRVGQRILASMPAQPFTYRFFVIKEDDYNAMAGPGGLVFINSGLFAAMGSEEELAGILSHEISHVANRHLSQRAEKSKTIGLTTLAGIAAGILLHTAGISAVSEAVTIGTIGAAQSLALAYSREDEMQADRNGLRYLLNAGYTGNGLLTILKKMRNQEWLGPDQIPTYLRTHPALDERLVYIGTQVNAPSDTQTSDTGIDPDEFNWPHTKLVALYGEESGALSRFKDETIRHPDSALAHYGYGLALARTDDLAAGAHHLKKALEKTAFSPHILKDLGRIYFMSGQYEEALDLLKGGLGLAPEDPQNMIYLGRTQIALGRFDDAVNTLESVTLNYEALPDAVYFLGEAYSKQGRMAKAHFHLGEYYREKGQLQNALFHLKKAEEMEDNPEDKKTVQDKLVIVQDKLKKRQRGSGSRRFGH